MKLRLSALGGPTVAVALAMILTGCGSGSAAPVAGSPTSAAPTSAAPTEAAAEDAAVTSVDPCHWFTAQEMSKVLGFTVTATVEDTPMGYKKECAYNSDAEFTKITVLPMGAAEYDSLKKGLALYSTKVPVAVTGVGDDAYDDSRPDQTNGSLSLNAKKGGQAVQVSLATANDKIKDLAAARKIVVPVAQKVLAG